MVKKPNVDSYADSKWGYYPEGVQESINPEDYVIGIYYAAFSSTLDPWYMGKVIIQEQTVGSYYPVHSDPRKILRKFSGKVIGVYEIPPYEIGIPDGVKECQYIIQVAYPRIMKDLGNDIMIRAGVGIHSHPKCTRAGAKAFRQVIDIGMTDLEEAADDLEDYLDDHEDEYKELQKAIESWGKDTGIKYLNT